MGRSCELSDLVCQRVHIGLGLRGTVRMFLRSHLRRLNATANITLPVLRGRVVLNIDRAWRSVIYTDSGRCENVSTER